MHLLEVRDLVAGFGRGFRVGPANIHMDRGLLHVTGPNGGGKTTLMKAIGAELMPTRGCVLVAGQDVHRRADARRNIALVSAVPELPEFLTVREAWQFTASLRRARGWDGDALCEALGLDPALLLANASAGQRQKAELICGLAGDPQVLLLDEIFAHLDRHGTRQLHAWIAEWATSRVVVVAHHGELPVQAHAMLRVGDGRVVFETRP